MSSYSVTGPEAIDCEMIGAADPLEALLVVHRDGLGPPGAARGRPAGSDYPAGGGQQRVIADNLGDIPSLSDRVIVASSPNATVSRGARSCPTGWAACMAEVKRLV